ncbi:ABC transporter permease [Zhouia sp. PK063]|uniref:ABC transporter permease n=1 Tax=Zhouia sp. PK063 TaxID=3373602 RepID=UPI003798C146
MIWNYLKIAWRSLWKHKWFSAINILGLALGMTTCLLILLFIRYELSYDKFNKKADQIVRVVFKGHMNGGEIKEANVMPPVAQTFKDNFPEVLAATRLRNGGVCRLAYKDQVFREDHLAFIDRNFLEIFTLPLLQGNASLALKKPNTIIISQEVATKLFGKANPMGKSILVGDKKAAMTITGVFNGIPDNSHLGKFDVLASMEGLPEAKSDSWMTSNFFTYLLLKKGTDYSTLEHKFTPLADEYISPQLKASMGVTMAQFKASGNHIGLYLQPLTAIHLHSDLNGDMKPAGEVSYVYILSAVAVFMLLIACINFMNLSTAGATKRAKEVGIRKTLGSLKGHLIGQFLLESIVVSIIALVFALFLTFLLLPVFESIAGQRLMPQVSSLYWILPFFFAFALIIGLLAGSYPAFYLSSFRPVTILKGMFTSGKKSLNFRNALVVFQFFISIALIIGTITVYHQLSYIQHKKLGYRKEQVLVIEQAYWLGNKLGVFKDELLNDPRVSDVSTSGYLPAGISNNNNYLFYPDLKSDDLMYGLRYEVDENYIPTLGMTMVAGRNFSSERLSDSTAIIINETTAKALHLSGSVLGHTLSHSNNDGKIDTYTIIGVVKDFNFKSLHEKITPLVMTLGSNHSNVIVKFKATQIHSLLSSITEKWQGLTTASPFIYSFLDTRFENTYKTEQNIGRILGIFSLLTIFVACLGLFGLGTFTAQQRQKEIGIRKVLGAKVVTIIFMLLKDFLILILISFVIAAPVAWYFMHRWLQDFAYRISIGGWIFVAAGALVGFIAVFTVGFKAITAAVANPVKSLRTE